MRAAAGRGIERVGSACTGTTITYSPTYTIQGAPDASSVALWKQLMEAHDEDLVTRKSPPPEGSGPFRR
jgi:hypothetical protein